ncbi:MFS transporter [Microbacterium sp. X-17]|uniref:MFS transporter n=1 Tax=Microbacterium sp. X-17 TaxID=3144404 RepID=UPI0031F52A58
MARVALTTKAVGTDLATIEEPTTVGTSMKYLRGAPLRRYTLWFALSTAAFTAIWAGVSTILLPNQVQIIEFANWFVGSDATVNLQQLQQLQQDIAAGTATATADQARQLSILAGFDGARAQSLALVTAIGVVGTMLIQPIVGVLSDRTRSRIGRRAPWILFGVLVGGAFLAGLRFAPTIALAAILWTIAQVVLNMALAPLNTTLADRVTERKRGTVSSMVALGTFAGGIIGGVGAGIAFGAVGLDLYFVFAAAVALLGVLFVLILRDRSSKDLAIPPLKWGAFFKGFLIPLRAADFRWVWIARLLLTFGYTVSTALALYMLQSYVRPTLSVEAATGLVPLLSLAGVPGTLIAVIVVGRISDRIGRRKPFVIAASILMSLSMIVPFVWPAVPALFIQAIAAGIAFGIYLPIDQALFVDVLPDPNAAGRDLGVAALGSNLGQALGPILAAQIVALTGGYGLIWVAAFVLVAIAGIAIIPVKGAR